MNSNTAPARCDDRGPVWCACVLDGGHHGEHECICGRRWTLVERGSASDWIVRKP